MNSTGRLQNIHYGIRTVLTLFTLILIPVYWKYYGPQNFLWFSDIGLFLTVVALWLESHLLMSTVIIAVLPVEIAWNIDFFVQLLTTHNILGIANYMFEPQYSFFLKSLSLFHVIMPLIWFFYLWRWGYNKRALKYAIALAWSVLILTYLFTEPGKNINWVFTPQVHHWQWISPLAWVMLLMIGFTLLLFGPLHIWILQSQRISIIT